MTTQSYQPQVNLAAVEPAARQNWRLGMLIALAALGALALVFMYYRWFGNIPPGSGRSGGRGRSAGWGIRSRSGGR